MKNKLVFLASAIGLTLLFYMAAYYFLPAPPPSGMMVGLFAAVALAIVWAIGALLAKRHRPKKNGPPPPVCCIFLLVGMGVMASLVGCNSAPSPKSTESRAPASPEEATSRVTGTAVLLPKEKEPTGYGLYSYALLFHPPSAVEVPRYTAFLRALVELPTAEGLAQYVPNERINLTFIPLTAPDPGWGVADADAKVAFILKHYDYARSAAIRSSLASKTGVGPVLISVLHPIDPAVHPHPVLVQDMSLAQASLMSTYVQAFVNQAAQDRFWEASTLSEFALGLRNSLETAAMGLNLSKGAVDGWVKFFK